MCSSWVIVGIVLPSWAFREAPPMITVDTRLVSEEDSSLEPVFCRLLQSKVLALSLLLVQIIRLSRHSGLRIWVWWSGSRVLSNIFCCFKHSGFPGCIERFWILHL
jgi:hypothetical protein